MLEIIKNAVLSLDLLWAAGVLQVAFVALPTLYLVSELIWWLKGKVI